MSLNRVILWLSLSDLKWNILSSDWQQAPSTQLAKCALQPKWILLMYLMPCCALKLPTPPYSCCPDHNSHRHLNGTYLDSLQIHQFCLILWSRKTMLRIPKAVPSHCLSLWCGGQPVGSQNVALFSPFFSEIKKVDLLVDLCGWAYLFPGEPWPRSSRKSQDENIVMIMEFLGFQNTSCCRTPLNPFTFSFHLFWMN